MSQFSVDITTLGNIVSNLFRGKANVPQTQAALNGLGQTITQQVAHDVGQVETFVGPQAAAAIQTGLADVGQMAAAGLAVVDEDLQPYAAGATMAVETAVDALMAAAIPGAGGVLSKLVNGGIDALEGALVAAAKGQFAAWKAKLAAQGAAAITPPAGNTTANPT